MLPDFVTKNWSYIWRVALENSFITGGLIGWFMMVVVINLCSTNYKILWVLICGNNCKGKFLQDLTGANRKCSAVVLSRILNIVKLLYTKIGGPMWTILQNKPTKMKTFLLPLCSALFS